MASSRVKSAPSPAMASPKAARRAIPRRAALPQAKFPLVANKFLSGPLYPRGERDSEIGESRNRT